MNDHSSGVSPSVSPNSYGVENIANAETQRQLIAAHRALSGIEHALQFAPRSAAISFWLWTSPAIQGFNALRHTHQLHRQLPIQLNPIR